VVAKCSFAWGTRWSALCPIKGIDTPNDKCLSGGPVHASDKR
jgi:hypothetical protein